MRKLLSLAVLLPCGILPAQQIVVFGETDFVVLDAGAPSPGPGDPDRVAFLEGFRADLARKAPYGEAMDLVNPPSWGKTVSAATRGEIRFHKSFARGFACRLTLENLLPDHEYILTLNGNPERAGNSLLLTPVPKNEKERYYDFLIARTDPHGRYDASLGVYLRPGAYDVRCYVKDTADFKIVLYRDFFKFTVE
ncbi:MAG TPA: hypothetical protein VKG78_06710 [Opitutaceae bacterium]|nr:hypothetical protein [Opitutaceae bacterium]